MSARRGADATPVARSRTAASTPSTAEPDTVANAHRTVWPATAQKSEE